MRTPPSDPHQGPGYALLWACFLGASWTWIIGMCFPALLVRDHGLWGWAAFAVPNVVGAAAMGFVLSTDSATRLWREHRAAVRGFSDVTIAFHAFVMLGLGDALFGPAAWVAVAIAVLLVPASRRTTLGPWLPAAAIGVSLVSFGCFVILAGTKQAWAGVFPAGWLDFAGVPPEAQAPARAPVRPLLDLWLFVPAAVTGFLLCPYLDGSFLRARASTGKLTGRAAFTVGFGVVFFSNIVFALMYAGLLAPAFAGEPVDLKPVWAIVLGIHLCLQAALTTSIHVRERMDLDPRGERIAPLGLLLAGAVGLVALQRHADPRFGEWGYRAFLLAYGLVFPAYVWIVILCGHANRPLARRAFFLITPPAALLGGLWFIAHQPWALPAGLVLITAAGVFVWSTRRSSIAR